MLLDQGLYVTAVGMGLVFLSLAIVLFAIKALDRLFPAGDPIAATAAASDAGVRAPSAGPVQTTESIPKVGRAPISSVFEATLGGQPHRIEVGEPVEGSRRVVLDGEAHQVERQSETAGGIVIDGRRYAAEVVEVGSRAVKVKVGETVFEIRLPDSSLAPAPIGTQAGPTAPSLTRGEPVLAPLPGRVLRVLVAASDSVARGQELCVIEAMKMENSIRAPRDGVVGEVKARAGQSVAAGEPLLYI